MTTVSRKFDYLSIGQDGTKQHCMHAYPNHALRKCIKLSLGSMLWEAIQAVWKTMKQIYFDNAYSTHHCYSNPTSLVTL